jgi:predicted nucleic-acid-binding Zn-ribbon protein
MNLSNYEKEKQMSTTDQLLAQKFVCEKCGQHGAHVERLAMSGTGLSRLFEIQAHRYAFVTCHNCGFTEVYNLRTLEGKDNLGSFLEVLFMD